MTPQKLYDILQRYAESRGIELNKDRDFVLDILRGLLKNEERYGYRACPCRLASGHKDKDNDIICPCKYSDPDIQEFGSCYCGLYVSKQWNEGSIKRVTVPERRQQT